MIEYDRTKPLIIIHIPKTAGTSSKEIYKKWFANNLYFHYRTKDKLPDKLDLEELQNKNCPIALYGHFNRSRKFGIEEYYPNVKQFVTILRDPYELHLSRYFFLKNRTNNFEDSLEIPSNCSLEDFLIKIPSVMLEHFPRLVTATNYKNIIEKYFIEIGITEKLDLSLLKISKKLGFEYTNNVPKINTTKRDSHYVSNAIKTKFMQLHDLEYKVYNYVLSKYK